MLFNDNVLKQLAKKEPIVQGTLQYMRPQGNGWYQTPAYKERIFKLVHNLLFYYRTTEQDEPLGAFVLEHMEVAYETPGPAFAFSLTSNDGKHIFACRCQEDLNKWVSALKVASYTYWQSLHEVLKTKLAKLKSTSGCYQITSSSNTSYKKQHNNINIPSLPVRKSNDNYNVSGITNKMSKSTFYSQSPVTTRSEMSRSTFYNQSTVLTTQHEEQNKVVTISKNALCTHNVPVDNLIDL